MPSVEVLNQPHSDFHKTSQNNVVDEASPPAKRRKTDLMDIKELANFLREEHNLVTELPPHVRDSIIITPDAIALYSYYVRQLISRDYTMTQNDYFINRLPIYLPAIAQVRALPDGGSLYAHDLIYRVAIYHFHKLVQMRGRSTPVSIKAFHAIDEAMLAISLDLWEKEPARWRTRELRDLIDRIRAMKRDSAHPDMAGKYLHRTSQFLGEMQGVTAARMLARRVAGTRLPPELVDEVERCILAANRLPYLPTSEAVKRLWVPRPVLPKCPLNWQRCSRTCPELMEVDWMRKERRFVYYHQGRQRCRYEDCRGHHDYIPDDPYDKDFLLYRSNGGVGFFD